jgi:hypothetical protein
MSRKVQTTNATHKATKKAPAKPVRTSVKPLKNVGSKFMMTPQPETQKKHPSLANGETHLEVQTKGFEYP